MTEGSPDAPHSSTAHQRVREIFFAVCDLHGVERDAAIAQTCGADDAIRTEVLRLLRRDAAENDLLADDAVDSGAAFDAARAGDGLLGGHGDAATRATRLPVQIGGYRILRRIGVGGMGTVYEAEQQDPRRLVAVKTLQRWSASPSLIRRFRHEAQVLGRLQHPGIAQIFEARVHEPGDGGAAVPFFVMELIRGQPVTAFIRGKGVPIAGRLELFIRICDAVAYAHRHGVIHRDLKPDNILVDEAGQPKVLDFGIAKTTDSDRHAKPVTTLHTDVGQLVGTLPYMSPEQVGGDPALVDCRSDVYALGVVLYEMLTDRLPYLIRDRSIPEAVRVIREESHTRLSDIDRVFRGDLETILAKALEKDAGRRYQSVPQLATDVQRYLDHEPISARPPSTFYQFSKFARRNKSLVTGVLGVIVALTLGVVGTTKFAIDAKRSALDASERERQQRWSNYLARIDAAAAALARHDVPAARRHLDEAPPEHRGWEWRHLERNAQQWALEIDCGAEIVGRVSLLPGDARVVAALADGRVCAWEIASGRMIQSVPIEGGIWRMADAAAGDLVAVATNAGEIVVLDMDAGTEIDRWSALDDPLASLASLASVAEPGHLNDMAISPDGAMVVLGTRTAIVAWNRPERRVAWRHELPSGRAAPSGFHAVTIAADGSLVAASQPRSGNRSSTWAWTLASGAEREPCRPKDPSRGIAIHPHGSEIAIGSGVRDMWIADASTMEIDRELTGHTDPVSRIAYSPDGRFIASQSSDSTIRVRSAEDGSTLHVLHASAADQFNGGLAFGADGARLVSRGASRVVVWDIPAEPSLVLRGHKRYVYTVAFSPDGTMLASGPFQGDTVRLWDPRSGEALAEHRNARRVTSLRFTDDGRHVEIRGGRSREWNTATGMLVDAPLRGTTVKAEEDVGGEQPITSLAHESKVVSTTISPDQSWLAVGCDNGEIAIWDVAGRIRVATLRRHTGRVYAVAFSPDGLRLASGGNDNSLRLWDTATWDQVLERHEHASYVYALAFSPDGTQLATASGDGTIRVWDSVDKPGRLAQVRAAATMRDAMRPRVAAMLEAAEDPAAVADGLGADASLDGDRRSAGLRVVLELALANPAPSRARSASEPAPVAIHAPSAAAPADLGPPAWAPSDAQVEAALDLAGANRPEIERFLARYDFDGGQAPDLDAQKRIAARWLVANMPGHGFARTGLVAADGRQIAFDASEHRNLDAAQARLDELEREHGPLDFNAVEFVPDLVAVTTDQLIQNHELAFDAWRAAPWADAISFETFLERILPHRATNERLDPSWREEASNRMRPVLETLRADLGRDPTLDEAARAAIKASRPWVRFRPLYYLHPTDQSWTEMCASAAGRCEDESNMALFAGRAAAVPLAGDSTPFWADRENNHAWVVRLDESGHGAAKLSHRAAKVVRHGYGLQSESLGAARRPDEAIPALLGGRLGGRTSLDVTEQYVPVSEVTVTLGPVPEGHRFASLCVFNGGAWRPVHWSEADHGAATFAAMGRSVLYLPAWYADPGVKPASAPFVLLPDGARRELVPSGGVFTLEIATTISDRAAGASGLSGPAQVRVAPDQPHELFVWDIDTGAWRSLGRRTATANGPVSFEDVPSGGLYWLRSGAGRALERPFVIDDGAVVHW